MQLNLCPNFTMKNIFVVCFVFVFAENVLGKTIINSYVNDKNVIDEECSILNADLIAEIQSYKPIVEKIVAAAVNGPYSGITWNMYAIRMMNKTE